jgi:hypothetical protein
VTNVVPDLKFINRQIPIIDVVRALDLHVASNGMIHCWRNDDHQHGDRTPSASISITNNRLKCFGCDIGPLGPVDLVMAVLNIMSPHQAAQWIAARFPVPSLAPGKHLSLRRHPAFRLHYHDPFEVLIQSGLWAELPLVAQAIAPVLIALGEKAEGQLTYLVKASYLTIARFSGVSSMTSVKKAVASLAASQWLQRIKVPRQSGSIGPLREVCQYQITPWSDALMDRANEHVLGFRKEIEDQKQMREEQRKEIRRSITK